MSAQIPQVVGLPQQTLIPVEQDEVLDLTHLVAVLWRHKLRLVTTTLLAAMIGGIWAVYVATPYYQATAVLIQSAPEEQLPTLGGLVPGLSTGNSAANTEVEIIRSRYLIGTVVDELALGKDPEFNPELNRGLASSAKGVLRDWIGPKWISPDLPLSPKQHRTLTIDRMQQVISVSNIPDSMIYEVVVDSEHAEKAAIIANTLAANYIRREINGKSFANEEVVKWLSTRVAQLQSQLETARSVLAQFSASMELITPATHASLAIRLKELRLRITTYETTEAKRSTVRVKTQLSELRGLEQELSTMLDRQSHDLVRLQQLESEVQAVQIIHAQFLERLNESAAQMDITQSDSSVLSMAEEPVLPTRPKPALVMLMVGVLGAVFAGLRILLRDATNKTFHTQQEMEVEFGLDALGQSQLIRGHKFWSFVSRIAHSNGAKEADSIRYLRNQVLSVQDQTSKVIMITSSLPEEGKTVLALTLAHSIAQTGQKVLVVDADLQRNGLQKLLKTPFNGLFPAIRQGVPLEESIWRCDELCIDILSGDAKDIETANIFSLVAFRRLVQQARKTYSVIIIDTPPVLAAPDAQTLGAQADFILFAVKWNKTGARAVTDGLSCLRKAGLKVDGLVLAQVDTKRQRRNKPTATYSLT